MDSSYAYNHTTYKLLCTHLEITNDSTESKKKVTRKEKDGKYGELVIIMS